MTSNRSQHPKRRKSSLANTQSPYYFSNGCLMKRSDDPNGLPLRIGRRVEIESLHLNIDTKEISYNLLFDFQNETHKITVPRETLLSSSKVQDLLKFGVDVAGHKIHDVHKHLTYQEEQVPMSFVHSHVGFDQVQGRLVYKHEEAYGYDSSYVGHLNIKPKGSFDKWKALIEKEVMGHPPLELALLLGLSAPVASLIGKRTGLEVIIFHLFGDSTQGKTTACRLAVSPFGLPDQRDNGLIKSWDATQNALFAELRGIRGLPIALDEASMQDTLFSSLIYKLASGQEKKRLNKEAQLTANGNWDGVLLSNGEHSLLTKSSPNVGIRMRLFEFGNIAWTTSAQNADSLKRGLLRNYGHAGPEFVQFLLKLPSKRLYRKWEYYCRFIRQKIQNPDRFTNRITDKLAILLVTAFYVEGALGLAFDRKKIRELLLQQIQENSEERDIGKRALEYLKQTVVQHSDNFTTRGREHWGLIKRKNGHPHEVLILPIQFKKILEAGGFGDSHQVILKNWATRGWLDCDKDKFTKKRTLDSGSLHTRVHVVLLQNESARE